MRRTSTSFPPRLGALAATVLALSAALASCRGERIPMEPIDLVARFPLATSTVATRRVDFGDPVSRMRLESGWSWHERDAAAGDPFVWGVGERSTIAFEVIQPADLELVFRCRSIRRTGLPEQRMTLDVNDVEIETIELSPRIDEYRVVIPGATLRGGTNELGLGYRFHRPVANGSRRALAVAWYDLRFGDSPDSGPPRVGGDRKLLVVPFDSAVHFPILAHPDGVFELGGWSRRGAGSGELELSIESDGSEPRTLAVVDGESAGPRRWSLAVEGPARLSIVARETGADRFGGAFALDGVRFWRPPPTPPPPASNESRRSNIVVYLVDTLRADRLGVYGHAGSLSPRLDAFAEDGVVFENAVAQSSWTRSAVASLLTGLWPGKHGTIGRRDRLPREARTLGELLGEAGYETVAVLTNPNVSGNFGFRQGFERYFRMPKQTDSVRVHDAVRDWIESYDGERPFFLYIHTADPHTPYLPPEPYRARFAADAEPVRRSIEAERRKQTWDPDPDTIRQLNALYDAEIAFNDDSFGRLIDLLRERGLYDDTFVAFVSDHGEEFYEHGAWTHGNNLYTETLDVPFVAKFPDGPRGRRVSRRVQQVDLVPTLLELVGAEIPPDLDGESLLPLLTGESAPGLGTWGKRPAFAHLKLDGPLYLAVEEADFKLVQRIVDAGRIETRLFDVATDPREQNDLAADYPITAEYLVSRLKEKTREGSPLVAEEALVDEELARELRRLGYVP